MRITVNTSKIAEGVVSELNIERTRNENLFEHGMSAIATIARAILDGTDAKRKDVLEALDGTFDATTSANQKAVQGDAGVVREIIKSMLSDESVISKIDPEKREEILQGLKEAFDTPPKK